MKEESNSSFFSRLEAKADRWIAKLAHQKLRMENPRGLPTIEDVMRLDLTQMLRDGLVTPGVDARFTVTMPTIKPRFEGGRRRAGQQGGAIEISARWNEPAGACLRISGKLEHSEPWNQRVALTCTPATYGGLRWWLTCPKTGRRCLTLFKPWNGQSFVSRQASRLKYRSQRVSKRDRYRLKHGK